VRRPPALGGQFKGRLGGRQPRVMVLLDSFAAEVDNGLLVLPSRVAPRSPVAADRHRPAAVSVQASGPALPPALLSTCLTSVNRGGIAVLVIVQVAR
jgi:hypothetical protein